MDPTLQAKIDEARANGYSDEEINAYIENAGKPLAQNPPMDRTESMIGTGQGIGLEAAKLGAEGYLGYKAGKLLLNQAGKVFGNAPVAPVAPTQAPATIGNAAWDRRINPQGMMDRAANLSDKVKQIAMQRITPVIPSVGAPAIVGAGGAAATGLAGGIMGGMTPEQRKQFYENSMLGAMGGDNALGAAIMNRGQ